MRTLLNRLKPIQQAGDEAQPPPPRAEEPAAEAVQEQLNLPPSPPGDGNEDEPSRDTNDGDGAPQQSAQNMSDQQRVYVGFFRRNQFNEMTLELAETHVLADIKRLYGAEPGFDFVAWTDAWNGEFQRDATLHVEIRRWEGQVYLNKGKWEAGLLANLNCIPS